MASASRPSATKNTAMPSMSRPSEPLALDEPREQGAEQAEPAQGLQERPGHSSRQPDHGGKDRAGDGKGEHDDPQKKTHGENLLKVLYFLLFSLYMYIITLQK